MRGASVVLLLLLAACGGKGATGKATSPASPPDDTIRRYASAIERDDPRGAYDLLAAPVRERVDWDSFARRWKDQRAELLEQAAIIRRRIGEQPTSERATLTYPSGARIVLTRGPAGWRLERPLSEGAIASTPWEAVSLFAEALTQRSYRQTARIVVGPLRERMDKELAERADALKKARPADLEKLSPTRYRLRFGDYWLELQRERGVWKIANMD